MTDPRDSVSTSAIRACIAWNEEAAAHWAIGRPGGFAHRDTIQKNIDRFEDNIQKLQEYLERRGQ